MKQIKEKCDICGEIYTRLDKHVNSCRKKHGIESPITIKQKKGNLTIVFSDTHFGSEHCLYQTFDGCIDKMCQEILILKQKYIWKNVFLVINGDIVSGTMIYRNQYIENQINKNEAIIMVGAYLVHKTIKKLESVLDQPLKIFIVAGNHEVGRSPLPHNFSVGIARRLSAYGHDVKYSGLYLILNIGRDFEELYNCCFFHSWGNADYSSASPSVIRELTRAHSQLATQKGIVIRRFCVGHSHWLETGRNVLGVRFDVTGGFQRWVKTISNRESGIIYYTYSEGCVDVHPISGLKYQLKESNSQWLDTDNLRLIADITREAFEFEIKKGLLKE